MSAILEINGLWKEFQRGVGRPHYSSLRDELIGMFARRTRKETFWALQDIGFRVEAGESLAIIGKNGAGKSTLLKILSRITPPTKGEVILRGRLASLLEVGTGFHQELNGRENIFLNGSILGLSRSEIQAKYDEIVDFSGVESFLATPLKHYSSGMQLRLAFAVAAHLEPEILVIDEVLAVGDSAFQKKCIDKMTEVSRSGRTILFVSHNTQAVRNLCNRALLLDHGRSVALGLVDEILDLYSKGTHEPELFRDLTELSGRRGAGGLIYSSIRLSAEQLLVGDHLTFTLAVQRVNESESFKDLDFGVAIIDRSGNTIHHFSNRFIGEDIPTYEEGMTFRLGFDVHLKPGLYEVALFLRASDVIQDWFQIDSVFRVAESNLYGHNDSQGITSLVQQEFSFATISDNG